MQHTRFQILPDFESRRIQCAPLLRQIDTRDTRILLIGLADQQTCTFHALDRLGQRRQFHPETGCKLRLRGALFSPEYEEDQLLRNMQTELTECFFRSLAMLFHQLDELIVQTLFKGMHVHFSVLLLCWLIISDQEEICQVQSRTRVLKE